MKSTPEMGLLRRIAGFGELTWNDAYKVLIKSLSPDEATDALWNLINSKKLNLFVKLPKEKK